MVSVTAKLSLAGLMAAAVKSASRIENIGILFNVEVEVEQFIGAGCNLNLLTNRSCRSGIAVLAVT
jgi:hypothetical protein